MGCPHCARSGGVRRRAVADHEAAHVSVALARGWRVNHVAVHDGEHGATDFTAPPLRDEARSLRERLEVTIGPAALGCDGTAGDGRDPLELAREIARPGAACLATDGEVNRVLAKAFSDVRALAESHSFKKARIVLRGALVDHGELDADLVEHVARLSGFAKRKPTATPRQTVKTSKPSSTTDGAKPKASRACRECGHSYAPHDPTGRCSACRS